MNIRFVLFFVIFYSFVASAFAQTATEIQTISFGQVSLPTTAGQVQIQTSGGLIDITGGGAVAAGHHQGIIRYSGTAKTKMTDAVISLSPLVGPGTDIVLDVVELSKTSFRLDSAGVYDVEVGATVSYGADQAAGTYVGSYSVTYEYEGTGNAQTFIGTVELEVGNATPSLILGETVSLNFGTLSLGTTVSSVQIDTNDNVTVLSGTVTPSGTPSSAVFDVVGASSSNVYVTFSSSVNLTNGVHTIVLDNLVKDGGNSAPLTLSKKGEGSFTVGGDLTLPTNLSSGTYTGTYSVTVNY